MKHTKDNTRKLYDFVDLKYNRSEGGIFRLAKGKSPLIVTDIMQHEKVILIKCMYLKSGCVQIYTDDKDVVPLIIGTFEDDNNFISKEEKRESLHLGCANWPNCDTEGCGEH